MDKYLYWLDCIDGLGANAKRNLIEAFGSAEDVFKAPERFIYYILENKKLSLFLEAKKRKDMDVNFENMRKQDIRMCSCFEEIFPEKLKVIPDVPFAIYFKGKLPEQHLPAVAVIGARECSQYGEYIAKELGVLLGKNGIPVISGMAKGIDGITQMQALNAGGVSYAVLGCGVDICYPKTNQDLYERLMEKGGIISTYVPGTAPQAKLFPARNRIVSGLSDVLVVIEARRRSGTSITVEMALEQGKDIFAVPGRITDRLSDGCNKMIKDGAQVFLSPEDFLLDLYEMFPAKMEVLKEQIYKKVQKNAENINEKVSIKEENNHNDLLVKKILQILDFYPQSTENIMFAMKDKLGIEMKQEDFISKMMYLCIHGLVKQDSQGWFSRRL